MFRNLDTGTEVKPIAKTVGVYRITILPIGAFYIGSSSDITNRVSHHLGMLNRNVHFNDKFQSFYNQTQQVNVDFQETENREIAYQVEQAQITSFWGNKLLCNVSDNARLFYQTAQTQEVKNKRAQTMNTDEFIAGQSVATARLWQDPEYRAKTTSAMKTPENIARMKEVLNTPEVIEKRLAAIRSPEQRAARGEIMKELWQDPAYVEKVKASRKNSDKVTAGNAARQIPISIDGKIYPSTAVAATELNLSVMKIRRLAANPKETTAFFLR